jgi:hypothetical protein
MELVVPDVDRLQTPPSEQVISLDTEFQWSRGGAGVNVFRLYAFHTSPRDRLARYPSCTIIQTASSATLPTVDPAYTPSYEANYAWLVERINPPQSCDDAATESFVAHYFGRGADHCISESRVIRFR